MSSQLFGTTSYYLFGYTYADGELNKYPYAGSPLPDIINEGFLVIVDSKLTSVPGFNTPGQINGFARVGTFTTREEAREFYEGYREVESGLKFVTVSDTVKLHQVWVQQTSGGNYVKLLVKGITNVDDGSEKVYNEVVLEYVYQPDGSGTFPE